MIPWQIEKVETTIVPIELRSTPLWLMERYLLKLGGKVIEPERLVVGPGWEAHMEKGEPLKLGSLRIGVAYLKLYAAEETLGELMQKLGLWLMRGGG